MKIRGLHSSPGVYTAVNLTQRANNNNRTTVLKSDTQNTNTTNGSGGGHNSYDSRYMFIDGSNYKGDLPLVQHSISNVQWTIKRQDDEVLEISSATTINVEYGAKVDYYGEWQYFNKTADTKLPTACEGTWGEALPVPESALTYNSYNIEEDALFKQTITAPQTGLIVKDNKVVVADQIDSSTVENSITFQHRIYFGVSNLEEINEISELKELRGQELVKNINNKKIDFTANNEYIYIAWPIDLGEKIWNIGGLDIQPIQQNITIINDYGKEIEYIITRSENTLNSTINVILT